MTISFRGAEIRTLGIVGSGAMGRGIAQIAALGGLTVRLFDTQPQALTAAHDYLSETLDKLASKGKILSSDADAALARVHLAHDMGELADCDVVIEAIVEKLDVKRELFRALEGVVSGDCILASNTSSLSITAIAAGCTKPDRVAGLHFFNPVPLMKVVEVIDGLRGDPADRRRAHGARPPDGPHAGAREGHAGVHRESRRARHEHRGLADRRAKAWRVSPISTGSCASRPASASGRSSCST